jgi:type 1 glutamine amidotransferase
MKSTRIGILCVLIGVAGDYARASDRLILEAPGTASGKKVVLISGDEEYRSEEALPMLAKILSQRHGYQCVVLFSFGPDGAAYIDSNNQQGLRGLEELDTADLMIIATRFRQPDAVQAEHITKYLNSGKPVIGLRTATHAFRGNGSFGGDVTYNSFGRKILGEEWVSHHGNHKVEGARSVVESGAEEHPILRGVGEIFAPSDVYGVVHLTDSDHILLRGAVTETLDPASRTLVNDERNKPMQPLAWHREYTAPNGTVTGQAFCTTAGASVDFVDEDLRRLIINAAIHLTGGDVPDKANVDYVDPYYPTFFCFINDPEYYRTLNWTPETFALGQAPHRPDPPGNPDWPHRPVPPAQ